MNNVRKNHFLVLIKSVENNCPMGICFSECKNKIKVLLLLTVIKPLKHVRGKEEQPPWFNIFPYMADNEKSILSFNF